jgi:hypothetical protein
MEARVKLLAAYAGEDINATDICANNATAPMIERWR